jgi:photosystem II stability/assembly factor-like uncharacterized protein
MMGGVFLSTNEGNSWTQINNGLSDSTVSALAINNAGIFAGTDDGVFLSTNNGAGWMQSSIGLVNSTITSLAVSGNNIFAGTDAYGVYLLTDGGTNWGQVNNDIHGTQIYSLAANDNNIYTGTPGGIYLSTDSGASWTSKRNGMTASKIISFAFNGSNIFAGTYTQGIFHSTDNGDNWTPAGLDNNSVLGISFVGNNIIAAASDGVHLSTDNGTSWTLTNNGLPANQSMRAIAVIGSNVFTATQNHGVYLTTNEGLSWAAVNNGLPDTNVCAIAVHGVDVFAGTASGNVFLSTNNGTRWVNINDGLATDETIGSFAFCGTKIYAGTYGAGVWERSLSEIVGVNNEAKKLPNDFALLQNYPNPFNPSTVISYSLKSGSFIRVIVYNALGETIKVLENEYKSAGSYSVTFNASGLSSGVYFYRLEAGQFTQVRKMVVMK